MLIHDRETSMAQARALQLHHETIDEDLENYVRELERIDKEESSLQDKNNEIQVGDKTFQNYSKCDAKTKTLVCYFF